MRFGGIFLSLFLFITQAGAQQNGTFADCYSHAEGHYVFMSERIISLFETASIDRFEFEKYRTELVNDREAQLRQCSDGENQKLRAQVKVLNQHLQKYLLKSIQFLRV